MATGQISLFTTLSDAGFAHGVQSCARILGPFLSAGITKSRMPAALAAKGANAVSTKNKSVNA
jgi:hypothetical protein